MNTRLAPHLQPNGSSPYIYNCALDETGSVSKATGYDIVGVLQSDFSTGVQNLGLFESGAGTKIIVANGGAKVKYLNTSLVWTDLPSLPTISTVAQKFAYQMFLNKLMIMCQTHFIEWDGSSAVTDRSALLSTKGDLMMVDGELRRLWAAGDDDNPSTVNYTAADSGTDFAGGGSFKVYDNDGSRIMGLFSILDTKFVLKSNKIVRIDFVSSVYVPSAPLSEYGPIGKEAWTYGANYIYMFTGSEVRAFGYFDNFSTNLRTNDFSFDVKPSILEDMNIDYLQNAKLIFQNNKLILTYVSNVQSSLVYDKQLVWDLDLPFISDENGSRPPCSGFKDFPIRSGLQVGRDFYFGDNTGSIFKYSKTYNKNGVAIAASYHTNASSLNGDSQQYKVPRYNEYEFKNIVGQVKVTIKGENNTGVETTSTTFNVGLTGFSGLYNQIAYNVSTYNCNISGYENIAFIRDRQSLKPMIAQTFQTVYDSDNINESFTLLSQGYIFEEKLKRRYFRKNII